jgi:hypothetical protein
VDPWRDGARENGEKTQRASTVQFPCGAFSLGRTSEFDRTSLRNDNSHVIAQHARLDATCQAKEAKEGKFQLDLSIEET